MVRKPLQKFLLILMSCYINKLGISLKITFPSRFRSFTMLAEKSDPVRVRFAPSPTGSLHVGGARTALFNWLLARKTDGKFIVRVEDTDEARSTRESERSILNDLRWLKLDWDEGPEVDGPFGPYRQSERKDIYKAAAEKLIEKGFAYRCFCTEEELETKRLAAEAAGTDPKYDGTWRDADPVEVQRKLDLGDPYTVRFKVPAGKIVSIDDKVRGRVTWDANASLGDFIIMRSNGMPVYNFCVSVDDANMQITHVIRAEEHLTNTLRQMLILEALEYKPPVYAHCSLILGSDRSKLSKRHGATSLQQFSEQGLIPEAMMNYLVNLGWNDGTPKEIYSPQELIEAFDMNRIVKSAAVFDMDKLRWINSQHLRALPIDKVQSIVLEVISGSKDPLIPSNNLDSISKDPKFERFLLSASKIAQRDMEVTIDATRLIANCLNYDLINTLKTDSHVEEVVAAEAFQKVVDSLIRDYESNIIPNGNDENFSDLWKTYMKGLAKELGLKGKGIFHPVRLCLTGRMSGPDVGDQIQLLSLSAGIISSSDNYPVVPLADRISQLKTLSVADALDVNKQSKIEKVEVVEEVVKVV